MTLLKLSPIFKDYIWGGTKLKEQYNKKSDYSIIAESWELCCHKNGTNIVENGKYKGKTLEEVISLEGKEILGENAKKFQYFPILIKLIDAKDDLSLQVHPDNEYALKNEREYGKTEMWYIVDCEKNAQLIYGFKKDITKEELKERIEKDTLLEVVNFVPVKKGDVFFIDAGTLHGIGKGILIAEIQQNSDTTYRVYDYKRKGADGKERPLHKEKAADVINTKKQQSICKNGKAEYFDYNVKTNLAKCEFFTTDLLELDGKVTNIADKSSFHTLLCIDGSCEVDGIALSKGETVFIGANYGEYDIKGTAKLIIARV